MAANGYVKKGLVVVLYLKMRGAIAEYFATFVCGNLCIMGMIEIGPRDELSKLYNKPANIRLKYCAVVAISIGIVLMLAMLVWMDRLSYRHLLLMKGLAGLFAIIFAVLYGVLVYRVNREYIRRFHK